MIGRRPRTAELIGSAAAALRLRGRTPHGHAARARGGTVERHGTQPPDESVIMALMLELVAAHAVALDEHDRPRHPATIRALARLTPSADDEWARATVAAEALVRPLALDLLRVAARRDPA